MSPSQMSIGGQRVAGVGAGLEVENPYTEQMIEAVQSASPDQVEAAVAAASDAWEVRGYSPIVD